MERIQAKDCKCVMDCGKQAVVFYPVFDPDIKSYPYCRECADKEQLNFLITLYPLDNERKKKGTDKRAKG